MAGVASRVERQQPIGPTHRMRADDEIHEEPLRPGARFKAASVRGEAPTRFTPDRLVEVEVDEDVGKREKLIDESGLGFRMSQQLGVHRRADDQSTLATGLVSRQ